MVEARIAAKAKSQIGLSLTGLPPLHHPTLSKEIVIKTQAIGRAKSLSYEVNGAYPSINQDLTKIHSALREADPHEKEERLGDLREGHEGSVGR
jgi:hypothetical protein